MKDVNVKAKAAMPEPDAKQTLAALIELSALDDSETPGSGPGDDAPARRKLLLAIPEEHVRHYGRLRAAGRRPAVTRAQRGTCAACHMRLPAQLQNLVERGAQVNRCPSCQRFLAPDA
jgi:hypothetical protein